MPTKIYFKKRKIIIWVIGEVQKHSLPSIFEVYLSSTIPSINSSISFETQQFSQNISQLSMCQVVNDK